MANVSLKVYRVSIPERISETHKMKINSRVPSKHTFQSFNVFRAIFVSYFDADYGGFHTFRTRTRGVSVVTSLTGTTFSGPMNSRTGTTPKSFTVTVRTGTTFGITPTT